MEEPGCSGKGSIYRQGALAGDAPPLPVLDRQSFALPLRG